MQTDGSIKLCHIGVGTSNITLIPIMVFKVCLYIDFSKGL
jgi:hypothetical protein